MAKRRGNPNWGKPEPFVMATESISSFDSLVKSLGLSPEQYVTSQELREWVRKNKDQKYVPQDLLKAWGFTASSEI
jgi:hypothetical protein